MLLLGGSLIAVALPSAAGAAVVWDGDASKGLAVFKEVQSFNGPITVVDDPTYGKVFKIVCNDNGNTKARSEVSWMAGYVLDTKAGDYYIAWRSKWGPLPTKGGKWQVLSQIHHDPVGLGGPVPFGLSVPGDGMMHFNAQEPSGRSYSMWDHPLPLDSWHRYILYTKMGETLDTGYCEIWFDGVKQTLTNGQQRIGCAMSRPNAGSHWKWGVYRSGAGGAIGQSVHYLQHPVMGTTLEDVIEDRAVAGGASGSDGGSDDGGTAGGATAVDAPAGAVDGAAGGGGGNAGAAGSGSTGQAGSDGIGGTSGSAGQPVDSPPPAKGGGGCSLAAPASPSPWQLLSLLLPLAALVLRRRARPR
jgi:hypothetical protein